ncbi:MAG: hydroxypyruvate isomerase [Paracoccus denitrificans]|nr:MAG: hydroxypyruvate isomerase [Paracoccus denitrificans]PZO84582.1 MAG: hydroxypyruvate isomerase [Paracoccus denitrificans]
MADTLRYSADLTSLFTELPILDRLRAARKAGFTGVEIRFPYDLWVRDLMRKISSTRMDLVLMNCPAPDWSGAPRGFAAIPGQERRFQRDFERALRLAESLRSKHLNIMPGDCADPEARETLVDNLKWAAKRAPHESLVIEPLDPLRHPAAFLTSVEQAAGVIAEVRAPNLGLLLDLSQICRVHGDPSQIVRRHAHLIRHIHISSVSEGTEPDPSDPNLRALMAALTETGYTGWIGASYEPRRMTETGISWLSQITPRPSKPPASHVGVLRRVRRVLVRSPR